MTKPFVIWIDLPDDHPTEGDPFNVATWVAMALDVDSPTVWPATVEDADTFFEYSYQALKDVTEVDDEIPSV